MCVTPSGEALSKISVQLNFLNTKFYVEGVDVVYVLCNYMSALCLEALLLSLGSDSLVS